MESDLVWFFVLGLWSILIVFAIKPVHSYMVKNGSENMVAVYYNRKIAHMLAGGVPIILSPIVFEEFGTCWSALSIAVLRLFRG